MKNKLIVTLIMTLMLSYSVKSQNIKLSGCAGVDYYTSYHFSYSDNNGNYVNDEHNNADFMKLITGATATVYENFSISFRAETFTLKDEAGWFSPTQVDYFWNIKYMPTPKIEVSVEHKCTHPIEREGWNYPKQYGGYDAIKVMFNF